MQLAMVIVRRGGDLAEAELLCREAIKIREDRFGNDHSEVTDAMEYLAVVLLARGDSTGGRATLEAVLARRTADLGPSHADTKARTRLEDLAK